MTYVVLGMHKSGTTLVAEILHRSGIPMVETASESDYYAGNKWERESTLAFDKQVLAGQDVDSLWLTPPDPASLLSDAHLMRAREIVARADAGGEWGFKDPRACLTWPIWQRVLQSPKLVGVYRHHGAVVQHFGKHAARAHRRGPLRRLRMEWLALRRWCEYNERVLAAIERADGPSILLSYERLMEGNVELDRLRRFVGRELADPRNPELARDRAVAGWRSRVGARAAQILGAGSATAIWARLEATRAELVARAASRP